MKGARDKGHYRTDTPESWRSLASKSLKNVLAEC
jgi:hypothetical protein